MIKAQPGQRTSVGKRKGSGKWGNWPTRRKRRQGEEARTFEGRFTYEKMREKRDEEYNWGV